MTTNPETVGLGVEGIGVQSASLVRNEGHDPCSCPCRTNDLYDPFLRCLLSRRELEDLMVSAFVLLEFRGLRGLRVYRDS